MQQLHRSILTSAYDREAGIRFNSMNPFSDAEILNLFSMIEEQKYQIKAIWTDKYWGIGFLNSPPIKLLTESMFSLFFLSVMS